MRRAICTLRTVAPASVVIALIAAVLAIAPVHAAEFTVTSNDVAPGKAVPSDFLFNGFGCIGKNQSPELHWSAAPVGTQSFAVSIYDPDAPTGSGWWHWYVVNLPAAATSLGRGVGTADGAKLPAGVRQIRTDFGIPAYGGPCPPPGDKPHRYIVTVYALKVAKLDLPADATAALAGFMVNSNAIGKATLTFTFGR